LSQQPDVHCCIVEKDNQLAAACLFFELHGIVQAHLGGSANDYYRQSPFHLCLHHAMLWAKSRGNRWLHLGGGVGGDNDPLLKFKAGFSDARFSYTTARLILDERRYRELVEATATGSNTTADDLLARNFFPAYRSRRLEKV
jgi:lipid II:glycine glycyltransferase (peptidoglycan interpeptide bridge formation enzyme)